MADENSQHVEEEETPAETEPSRRRSAVIRTRPHRLSPHRVSPPKEDSQDKGNDVQDPHPTQHHTKRYTIGYSFTGST